MNQMNPQQNSLTLARILSMALALGLSACSRKAEVTGQVFISTKSAGSYKLGAVPVHLFDVEYINPNLADYRAYRSNAETLEAGGKLTEAVKERLKAMDKNVDASNLRYAQTVNAISQIQNQWSQVNPASLAAESRAKLEAARERIKELTVEKDKADKEGTRLSRERDELQDTTKDDYDKKLKELRLKMNLARDMMFSGERAVMETSTDADGNFTFTMQRPGNYFLTAKATRATLEDMEEYLWVVPLGYVDRSQRVILNNANIFSLETYQEKVQAPEE
jgi:hypothetical protein